MLSGLSKSKPSSDPCLPLTPPLLQPRINAASKVSSSPFHQALFPAMFSLMFRAFLRIGEVTSSPHNLQFHQVTLTPSSVSLTFTSFKHSNGNPVMVSILSSTSTVICPVRLLHTYLALSRAAPGPLFCYTNLDTVPPSYFRAFLNSSLTHAGLSQYRFTPNSFTIGAATYAAGTGVPSEQFKVMGRWRIGGQTHSISTLGFRPCQLNYQQFSSVPFCLGISVVGEVCTGKLWVCGGGGGMWCFFQHTLYHLSTHVIVSFSCFPSMLVIFIYVYSSMTL